MDSMSIFKGELALGYYGRKVIIRVKHVSSTPEYITEEINTHSFQQLYKQISDKYKNKYIFVSVDNLNFLPGIKNKLEAYKRFLREIGHNYKQNFLLQYIENTEDDTSMNEDYYYNKDAIMDLAFSIKKEFGEDVIQIVEKNLKYAERLAVLASGKCFVKSSKRESFSMDIYDFLNLKLILNDTQEMGYILSELSGVTSSLSASIQINPFDVIYFCFIII
jgi:trehalose-6-phosphate synthase